MPASIKTDHHRQRQTVHGHDHNTKVKGHRAQQIGQGTSTYIYELICVIRKYQPV